MSKLRFPLNCIDKHIHLIILHNIGNMHFDAVVRKDEDGFYVATVPELPGCHTQAKSLDELMSRVKEAIPLYLETEGCSTVSSFVGVQVVEVETC